jgi:hypothetical protein
MELRRGQRFALAMWVRLSSSSAELGMARLANVSISGAFLETALQLPINSNVTLHPVSTAGVAVANLSLAARVARVEKSGVGIEWRELASEEVVVLLKGSSA